jgi:hypothetical protein
MDYFRLKKKMLMSITHKIKGFVRRASGTPSVKLEDCAGGDWLDLDISGNSLQNGTPTSDAPIEVVSVGELVTDATDTNYGKYKIPVTQRGIHIVNPKTFVGGTLVDNKDGSYTLSSTSSNRFGAYNTAVQSIPIGSRIVINANILDSNFKKPRLNVMVTYMDNTISYTTASDSLVYNINVSKQLKYIVFYVHTDEAVGSYITFKNLMVCYADELKEYEPYIEPVTTNIFLDEPLRKVGVYADYIDSKENKVIRNIGVGTSNTLSKWRDAGNYNCGITWGLPNCNYRASIALCTHLRYGYSGLSNGVYFDFIDAIYWYFDKTLFPTVADANRWIDSKKADGIPLRFHYVLITPREEPLNMELPQLPAQTVIVEIGASLAPTHVEVEYYSSVKG